MIRQLKADFRYAVYSKMFIGVLLLFFLTTLLSFFMNYQNACFEYESYQRDLEFYQQAGNDIEAELNAGYSILEGDTIENPLAYHHEKLSASLYSLKPDYVIPLLCEGSLVFFPILASFFGLLWAAADLKYKTLRHRVQRSGKLLSLWSRQLSGLLVRPCEKISVKSSTVIKTLDRSGTQTATPFFTVYNGYCDLSRCYGYQPVGMERSGMETG